ncbi:MAG: acetyl-CoA hydrolase/transferase C-terminal domain-containing protein [bacterium]
MSQIPAIYDSVRQCVDEAIQRVGKNIVLGLPIGVGKPTHIANEFYRRAKEDPSIKLKICSGLTLHTPIPGSDLERRIMEPLSKRLFGDYPDPVYLDDVKQNRLPSNVELHEIYFSPGFALNNTTLQQSYVSANFTCVARAMDSMGCNVVAVTAAKREKDGRTTYSLGSNVDAAIMMVWRTIEQLKAGEKVAILGQINTHMPYMLGTAELPQETFTGIVESPELSHRLLAPPKEPVSSTDYSIAFHVSALIKDGGTFQVGFGSLGDAIIYCLQLRHKNGGMFKRVIEEAKIYGKFSDIIEAEGGTGPFEKGLYGCSEFIFDGFLSMIDDGIIKRKVYDHPAIQKLFVNGQITEAVTAGTIDALLEEDAISERITSKQFRFLQEYGILKESLRYEKGVISAAGDKTIKADLADKECRDFIIAECLGDRLKKEILVHAGFFVGSKNFYETLLGMDDEPKSRIQMREISFVNDIVEDNCLKTAQRKYGRFVNTCMMASLMGGVASDTLDSGQVVSGVGGQYNFVSMAHQLPDARSILMVRSVREGANGPCSNITWTCGNITIPRHMRDIFVTEYGMADVRDKSDGDTIAAMLKITDSRFQQELLKKAKENKKISASYEIPLAFRNNYPEAVEALAAPFKKSGLFPVFPYGSDFTKEELLLGKALRGMKKRMTLKGFRPPSFSQAGKIIAPPAAAMPFLERMQLDKPSSGKEKILQKLVLFALAADGVI